MKHLMRLIVCVLVAVNLAASGVGLVASMAAMSGPADAIVKSDDMNCGACAKMPGALAGCAGSQCAMTGILPAANFAAEFQRAAFKACSLPEPGGCKYQPAIFPS